jgi:hypothetical protein
VAYRDGVSSHQASRLRPPAWAAVAAAALAGCVVFVCLARIDDALPRHDGPAVATLVAKKPTARHGSLAAPAPATPATSVAVIVAASLWTVSSTRRCSRRTTDLVAWLPQRGPPSPV